MQNLNITLLTLHEHSCEIFGVRVCHVRVCAELWQRVMYDVYMVHVTWYMMLLSLRYDRVCVFWFAGGVVLEYIIATMLRGNGIHRTWCAFLSTWSLSKTMNVIYVRSCDGVFGVGGTFVRVCNLFASVYINVLYIFKCIIFLTKVTYTTRSCHIANNISSS